MDDKFFTIKQMINAGYTRALKRYNKYHKSLNPDQSMNILEHLTRIVYFLDKVREIDMSDSERYIKLFDIQYEVFICERAVHRELDREID